MFTEKINQMFFCFVFCYSNLKIILLLHNTVADKPVAFCRKDNDPWQLVSQMHDYRIVSSDPDSANLEFLDADVKCVGCRTTHVEMHFLKFVCTNAFGCKLVKKLSLIGQHTLARFCFWLH